MKYILITSFLVFLAGNAISQNDMIGYGFRAGLSMGQYTGPSETGPNGETLETNKLASGFHIGMTINFKFGDLMGLRTELMFSQRGTDYLYKGPSYYVLGRNTLTPITIAGTRKQSTKVSNAYLDVPLVLYYRIKSFEISGGLNTGLLISSAAGGSLTFDGVSPITGAALTPYTINLNYNYKKDKAGTASSTTQPININGRDYFEPTIIGAYYDFTEKDKNLFKTLDFGLVAGLSYFLNQGLFLGVKYVHGLGDVDRNNYDISLQSLHTDGSHIPRSDTNKSRSWQFSVGFAF
ncbi:MAG: porin family protein [Saprospiraceae bacterium]